MSEISKDAILEKIDGIFKLSEQQFDQNEKQHTAILEQTTKTNGKVAAVIAWKERIHGIWIAASIFCVVLSFIIPICLNIYFNKVTSDKEINKLIDARLSEIIEKE